MDHREPTTQGATTPAPPAFSATLTPHRSLGPKGFLILMTALGAVSFAMGLAFAWIGAWPVLGFFGLDVLIVYIAFKRNYRSGRLYETVEADRETVTLTRVHPSGRRQDYAFPAYWAQVRFYEQPDGRTELRLASHGREVVFGQFLTNEDRAELATALTTALRQLKQAV